MTTGAIRKEIRLRYAWTVALPLLFGTPGAWAATRHVPSQFPTIQQAVNASAPAGDTVLVSPGTYVENLKIRQKDLVLLSVSGFEATTIDGGQPAHPDSGSVVLLQGVGAGGKLTGFTIRGGTGLTGVIAGPGRGGGGVCILNSLGAGPLIANNQITSNRATDGAGILLGDAGRVVQNEIVGNDADDQGGGIKIGSVHLPTSTQRPRIEENDLFGNTARTGGGLEYVPFNNGAGFDGIDILGNVFACNETLDAGAALRVAGHPGGTRIERNTVIFNLNQSFSPVLALWVPPDNAMEVIGNAIVFNQGVPIDCFVQPGYEQPTFECNDIHGNWPINAPDEAECGMILGVNNNFSLEPLFGGTPGCIPVGSDYCQAPGSPLLPENSPPGCGLVGARGLCTFVGIEDPAPVPGVNRELRVQPNPFTGRTTLAFELEATSAVKVLISNARGQRVAEMNPGELAAGPHAIDWDGRDGRGLDCPAGVYFVRIQAGERALDTRLLKLR